MPALQFVEYRGAANVQQVGWLSGTNDLGVDIRGNGFVDVVEVRINGVPCPDFLEMSPSHLLASVPASQIGLGVTSVAVFTAGTGAAAAAVIQFRLVSRAQAAGVTALVQRFLYVLLTTPGSDIFSPDVGAGLQRLLAMSMGPTTRALVARAVSDAETQLIRAQAREPVPDNERLAAARLVDLRYDRNSATTSLRVELTAVSGQKVSAGFQA